MKKTFSLILSIILIAALFIPVYAEQSGDFVYIVLDDGTAAITQYKGTSTQISIPSALDGYTITKVQDGFYDSDIESLTMSDNIIDISRAFMYCTKLSKVTLSNNITVIDTSAFGGCESLQSITIPNKVTEIGAYAFALCKSLNNVYIPSSVKTIKDNAFHGCESLKSITIPDTVVTIYDRAFGYYYDDGRQAHKYSDFKIYGYTGSEAQRYALDNGFSFISLGKSKNPVKITTTTSKTVTSTITTKKATIKKLTPKKKALKVTWKKVSGAQGYEIKLATNKKFTKNKKTVKVKKGSVTSKTIKKLKSGKKYYVKIRAYKNVTIDGYTVTANGAWSKVKSKKVK